ncbi:hypothetical protein YC2023_078275 [Brassica napus]
MSLSSFAFGAKRFRNQTWRNKVILGLQSLFLIFKWGSQYDLKIFRSDVVSGLTIASLAIPQVRHLAITQVHHLKSHPSCYNPNKKFINQLKKPNPAVITHRHNQVIS